MFALLESFAYHAACRKRGNNRGIDIHRSEFEDEQTTSLVHMAVRQVSQN